MKRPEEIAFCVDPMCGLYTASFTRLSKEFWFRGRKKLSVLRRLLLLLPLPRPLMEMMSHHLHH